MIKLFMELYIDWETILIGTSVNIKMVTTTAIPRDEAIGIPKKRRIKNNTSRKMDMF